MDVSMREELYARAIGWKVLEYLDKKADAFQFREEAAEDALDALEKI